MSKIILHLDETVTEKLKQRAGDHELAEAIERWLSALANDVWSPVLDDEFAAWDAASDEALLNFEASLN